MGRSSVLASGSNAMQHSKVAAERFIVCNKHENAGRPHGSVRDRANQYSRDVVGRNLSSGLENRKRCGGSAKLTKTATIGGDMLAVEGANTEEVAKLIMATTESAGRHEASEAAHTSHPSLD